MNRKAIFRGVVLITFIACEFCWAQTKGEFNNQHNKEEADGRVKMIMSQLRGLGVVPGSSLWLAQPVENIPVLSKFKFRTVRVVPVRTHLETEWLIEIDGVGPVGEDRTVVLASYPVNSDFLARRLNELFLRKLVWAPRIVAAIQAEQVVLGMTAEQLRLSWGRPNDINSTVGRWGRHEQWIYGHSFESRSYVYLENGRVTSWQN